MRKSIFAIVAITAMLAVASCQNAATETPVTIGADSTLVDSTKCVNPDSCAAVVSTSVTDTTVSK
ncbi:hypothetical protein UFOVP1604_126 [uncultured Caudovirales phage]|jgi:hypothetical protein|uniref:Uncharacterized protein n=1 Tax=uncultured Caudovirales phage TaxID=2100421 RepID=A0A6J5SU97_9CAUD|nr:hypothetical protein UFOVP1604_126 [uncultured Caudovirales phage]